MDIYQIRNQLKSGKALSDIPLKVVYYARVSTDKDEQINSLSHQQSYYENLITQNMNWQLAGSYVDEGLSGITTKNRQNFHAMIADAKAGLFDFVVTKEISRFARNTLDSIQYTRELLGHGVAVWFQQDNINTIDEDSELRLAIMSSLAQEESRRLSNRIRFGHEQSIKKGTVMGNSLIYGYRKDKGKLVVVEKEAEMVRMVYELYATGDYSTVKIERILQEKGYRNFKGGVISRNVLRKIIPNPKYKGWYCGNKVKVVDMFTKQQKFLDEEEWEMYPDYENVPPIVSEELWERANRVFSIRSQDIKQRRTSYKTSNLFTGKIICAEHNVPFYMKTRKSRKEDCDPTWVCSHRIKNGKDSCSTFGIREKELSVIILEVLNSMSDNYENLADKYMQMLNATATDDASQTTAKLEVAIDRIHAKKDKLLELVIDGKLSNVEFEQHNTKANDELAKLEIERKKLNATQKSTQNATERLNHFKKELLRHFAGDRQELTPGIVTALIDRIYVRAESGVLQLDIRLNTGDTALHPLGCSGYMVKKMIEAQERQMAGSTPTNQ